MLTVLAKAALSELLAVAFSRDECHIRAGLLSVVWGYKALLVVCSHGGAGRLRELGQAPGSIKCYVHFVLN